MNGSFFVAIGDFIAANREIFAAVIESCGVILAAVIATLSARKIVKESVNSRFHSYSEKAHVAKDLLLQAQNDVCIVVAIGDIFFKKYEKYLIKLIKKGIKIRYLLLEENRLKEAEEYMHGKAGDNAFRSDVVNRLREIKKEHKYKFEIREFDSYMTASYICIDAFLPDKDFISSSGVKIMLYQYKTSAESSPTTYISPKSDEKEFITTVQCIKQMWEDANPISEEKIEDDAPDIDRKI